MVFEHSTSYSRQYPFLTPTWRSRRVSKLLFYSLRGSNKVSTLHCPLYVDPTHTHTHKRDILSTNPQTNPYFARSRLRGDTYASFSRAREILARRLVANARLSFFPGRVIARGNSVITLHANAATRGTL